MPVARKDLAAIDWRGLFDYVGGDLVWRVRARKHCDSHKAFLRWNTMYAGKVAGGVDGRGYRVVKVFGKTWLQHRIVYAMHHGANSLAGYAEVDHADEDKANNKIENLRSCSHGQNQTNCGTPGNNSTGLRGITRNETGWMARVRVNGKRHHLGTYQTKGLAAVAYAKASLRLHGRFSTFFRQAA